MRNVDPTVATAVRAAAHHLAEVRPGRAVELRIPPYVAVQLGAETGGATHRRGTPPAVVEMDADTFLALMRADLTWAEAIANFRVSASGAHTDLTSLFESVQATAVPPAPSLRPSDSMGIHPH